MRLKVGNIEVEGDSKEDIKFLIEQAQSLAGAIKPTRASNPNQPKRLKTVGIIHRSPEEKASGLSIEDIREQRRRINAENGFTDDDGTTIEGGEGATFNGDLSDLSEVPIDGDEME